MLNLVEEFYEHENTFGNSVIPKEKYDRMNSHIRGAFENLMQDVNSVVDDTKILQVAVER